MVFGCVWKINFSENIFSWPCVLIDLNRKWFEVKIFTSNHLRTHTQRKREIALRSCHEPRALRLRTLRLRRFLNLIKYSFDFNFESHPDRTLRLRWGTQSLDHAFDFAEIAPRDRTEIAPRDRTEIAPISLFPDLVPPSSVDTNLSLTLSSFFSQFDRIWWIFFGWVLFLYLSIKKWYYIFVWKLRKCEEQEENVFSILFQQHNQTLENIFQSIFRNATKHLKIFSFPENSISGKYLFFGKHFT